MVSTLSKQEQRILMAARRNGEPAESWQIEFDWHEVARTEGIAPDVAYSVVNGLRRFGYVGAIGPNRARLTETGAEAAAQIRV